MRYHFAGATMAYRHVLQDRNVLVSFAPSARSQRAVIAAGYARSVILDSGAFSAWRLGQAIDLGEYLAFALPLIERCLVRQVVALDVIPGRWEGKVYHPPRAGEVEACLEQTLANLEEMLAAGVPAEVLMPVFHEGDPDWVLDHYLRGGFWVIGLGATRSRGKASLLDWLIPLVNRFHGRPHPYQEWPAARGRFGAVAPREVRFHLLGMGQPRILRHVPAFSADSTTWLNLAARGVAANRYLLRGLPAKFYDLHPRARAMATGLDDGAGMTARELQRLGADALLYQPNPVPLCPATRGGQLEMFPDWAA